MKVLMFVLGLIAVGVMAGLVAKYVLVPAIDYNESVIALATGMVFGSAYTIAYQIVSRRKG